MTQIDAIPLPLRHPVSVNSWLIRGDPLTLVDTGPRSDRALEALEAGLATLGVRLENLELVLATHHHLDHVGLMATIQRRSGAHVAVLGRLADYGSRYHARVLADRVFSHGVMAAHGVPAEVIDENESFWETMIDNTEAFDADERLADGDQIRAGGRTLRVIDRPGHSTTDTLFVDDEAGLAFVGDHLLADVSSNTEMYPPDAAGGERPRTRIQYLHNLRLTAAMPLDRLLTGHGTEVIRPAHLVAARIREHRRRSAHITRLLQPAPRTAFDVARELWNSSTVSAQPLLVIWEILGHLDVLAEAGAIDERIDDDGLHTFFLTEWPQGTRRLAMALPGPQLQLFSKPSMPTPTQE